MEAEVPCRDTDPVTSMDTKDIASADTALAFTIDFGEGDGDVEEKARRFERFAQRSSQRKVKSPRQEAKTEEKEDAAPKLEEERKEEGVRRNSTFSKPAWPREKSDLEKKELVGRKVVGGVRQHKSDSIKNKVTKNISDNRRIETGAVSDQTALAMMMANLGTGMEVLELHSYENDSFEDESDDEEETRALSETGTYVLDKEEEDRQKGRSRELLRLGEENVRPGGDKSSYVAEWAARHGTLVTEEMGSTEEGRRRRLPVTPASTGTCSPDSGPPSISPRGKRTVSVPPKPSGREETPEVLDAAEAWRRRKNYKPVMPNSAAAKTEVKKTASGGSTGGKVVSRVSQLSSGPSSARSVSSESSGYQSRVGHTKSTPLIQPQSTLIKSGPSRSISSLTSKEAEFQAWRRRKNYRPGQPSSSSSSSSSARKSSQPCSSSSSGVSQVTKRCAENRSRSKLGPGNGLEGGAGGGAGAAGGEAMQRANSFHYENKRSRASPAMARVQESEDEVENDFYLDGDELILPVYPRQSRLHEKYSCESFPREPREKSPSRSKTEALDNLVISTIHNVSSKLCLASSSLLRKAAKLIPVEDEEQSMTVETVQYLLEDIDLPTSPKKRTSRELSGSLKNLKKLEQVMEILNKLLEVDEEAS